MAAQSKASDHIPQELYDQIIKALLIVSVGAVIFIDRSLLL